MADHTLDREPGLPRIADDINTLKKQISELRTLQLQGASALNPQTNSGNFSHTLSTNQAYTQFVTLSSTTGKRLIVLPMEYTLYEGSIAAGNEIGFGNARDGNYSWYYGRDKQGTSDTTVVEGVHITYYGPGTVTVYVDVRFRYLIGL